MFRTIRKKKNELTQEAAKGLLHSSRRGVLAVKEEVKASGKAVQMFEITIEHMSGKEIQEI